MSFGTTFRNSSAHHYVSELPRDPTHSGREGLNSSSKHVANQQCTEQRGSFFQMAEASMGTPRLPQVKAIMVVKKAFGIPYALLCMIFISVSARVTQHCRAAVERVKLAHVAKQHYYVVAFVLPFFATMWPRIWPLFILGILEPFQVGASSNESLGPLPSISLCTDQSPVSTAELKDSYISSMICSVAIFVPISFALGLYSIAIREVSQTVIRKFCCSVFKKNQKI